LRESLAGHSLGRKALSHYGKGERDSLPLAIVEGLVEMLGEHLDLLDHGENRIQRTRSDPAKQFIVRGWMTLREPR